MTEEESNNLINSITLKVNRDIILSPLVYVEDYYKEISLFITNREKDLTRKTDEAKKELETMSYEDRFFRDEPCDKDWASIRIIKQTFCFSVIVSIYTIIEKSLINMCKILEVQKKLPIGYKDIRDNGVTGAKKYLKRLCGIEIKAEEEEFLSEINVVRNVIAHNNGELDNTTNKNKNKIENLSKKLSDDVKIIKGSILDNDFKHMEFDKNIELDFGFIEYCLEHGNKVLVNIFEQYEKMVDAKTKTFLPYMYCDVLNHQTPSRSLREHFLKQAKHEKPNNSHHRAYLHNKPS